MASATTLAILMALAANAVFLDASPQESFSAGSYSSTEGSVPQKSHRFRESILNSTSDSDHPRPSWRRHHHRRVASSAQINNQTRSGFSPSRAVHKYPLKSKSTSPTPPTIFTTPVSAPTSFEQYSTPAPPTQQPTQQPPFNCYCPRPAPYQGYSNYQTAQYSPFPSYPSSGQRPAPYYSVPSSGPSNQFPAPPTGFYDRSPFPSGFFPNNGMPEFGAPKDPFNSYQEPTTTTEAPGFGFQIKTVSRNRTEEGYSTHISSSSSW